MYLYEFGTLCRAVCSYIWVTNREWQGFAPHPRKGKRMHIRGDSRRDFAIYFGSKKGSRYIGFHFPLHNGWCSNMGMEQRKGWRIKGGWQYYQCAFLTGRLYTNESKWHRLPTVYIPAKLVHVWRMRKKSWRQAMKQQPKEKEVRNLGSATTKVK